MDAEDLSLPISTSNGTESPSLPPLSDEWQRLDAAYREIQRRDGSAEHRAWQWQVLALAMGGLFVCTLGVIVWQLLRSRTVQAFVQVVQVDAQGQLVQTGVPMDLLAYTPDDGLWMEMLSTWIQKMRWRGEDVVRARADWSWLYRHTCGQARRLLQAVEDKEKPFQVGKRRVAIEIKSVTKTPAPLSFQVLWAETSTDMAQPTVKTQLWVGTFSVGRYRPPTMADALENRLGVCTVAFDLSPQA